MSAAPTLAEQQSAEIAQLRLACEWAADLLGRIRTHDVTVSDAQIESAMKQLYGLANGGGA